MPEDDQFRTVVYEFMGGTKSTLKHLTESFEKLEDSQRQDKELLFDTIDKARDILKKDSEGLREIIDSKVNELRRDSEKKCEEQNTKIEAQKPEKAEVNKEDLKELREDIKDLEVVLNNINVEFKVGYNKIVAWASGAGFMVSLLFWLIKIYAGKYIDAGGTP